MLVVVIMIMFAIAHNNAAAQMLPLRPTTVAIGPAREELTNAPNVMSEEINCCLLVVMFHPVARLGSS